jgi:MFS family permease
MRQGPLAGRYPAAATMVVLALVPYLVLSAALGAITPFIARQLHMSLQAMSLTSGMANAGYAVGTVLAVQFAQKLPQRRMLVGYATLLVIGSVLAATATDPAMFIVGHILQGLCTSLLLIAAAPALFLGYPPEKLRYTAIIFNMCIFGAVALGPVVGGIQAQAHAWRPLFWVLAAIAIVALALAVLTFEDAPPADPGAPWDKLALGLATAGAAAGFFGASELLTHRFVDPLTLAPLAGGVALIILLMVLEYRGTCVLLNVRALVSTIPVSGITAALCTAAASVAAVSLSFALLQGRFSPQHLGLLYLPEFGGAVVAAVVFGVLFRTRLIHYLVLGGIVALSAGILVISGTIPPTQTLTLVGSGLIGVGVGAAVTPALFLVGFSLISASIQRVFAIVELLRAVAAFMIAPILLHLAVTTGGSVRVGSKTALWISFGIAVAGALVAITLYALGRVRPAQPSLDRWFGGQEPAWDSPPLLAGIRAQPGLALAGAAAARSAGQDGAQSGPPSAEPVSDASAERSPE